MLVLSLLCRLPIRGPAPGISATAVSGCSLLAELPVHLRACTDHQQSNAHDNRVGQQRLDSPGELGAEPDQRRSDDEDQSEVDDAVLRHIVIASRETLANVAIGWGEVKRAAGLSGASASLTSQALVRAPRIAHIASRSNCGERMASLLGGVGLFLIGMILLTEGLKAAAGDRLRVLLVRFTGGPIRSVAAGAAITTLVQSSSATTLTTIGFVSAGMLTFPQAVGVVFGANLGTTATGWIVAGLGFKLSILPIALPLVGIGALLRLLGRGWLSDAGLAVAGFGLLFVGIDTMQVGMAGLAERLDPGSLPGSGLASRLILLAAGALMTVLMQSSSAAVATTLAALNAGTIDLSQAGTLVIGQNIGTTVTAALAAIGASVPARRTALAHILFNLLTGLIAFGLLPFLMPLMQWVSGATGDGSEAMTIAAFHTAFNLLGVLIFLPAIEPFSRLVMRLIPDRGPTLTRYLDRSVTRLPSVAVEAAHRSLQSVLGAILEAVRVHRPAPVAVTAALDEIRSFLADVRTESESAEAHARHVAALHTVDHLAQLAQMLQKPPAAVLMANPLLTQQRHEFERVVAVAEAAVRELHGARASDAAEAAANLRDLARHDRRQVIEQGASGAVPLDQAVALLDLMRWFESAAHHLQRSVHYLCSGAAVENGVDSTSKPADEAVDR